MNRLCLLIFAISCVSLVVGKSCKYNYECSGKKVCVGGANACSGSSGLAVNDNQYYNTITYGSDCKASSSTSNFTISRLTSVNGSVPTTLYSRASKAKETVLVELYNSVYIDKFSNGQHTLQVLNAGGKQLSTVDLLPNFQGYLEIDGRPSLAYSCAFDASTSRYILNTYGGLEEAVLFTTPTKTLYAYPSGSVCGPSRLGLNNQIYLVSNIGATSYISVGSITCSNCTSKNSRAVTASPSPSSPSATPSQGASSFPTPTPTGTSPTPTPTGTLPTPTPTGTSSPVCSVCNLPAPFYNAGHLINDFDVSGNYIFYGTATGLYRYTISSKAVQVVFNGTVTGVDAGGKGAPGAGSSFVYFNTGTNINKIAINGSGIVKLNAPPTGACGKY